MDFPPAIEEIVQENVDLIESVAFWRHVSVLLAITAIVSTVTVFLMK